MLTAKNFFFFDLCTARQANVKDGPVAEVGPGLDVSAVSLDDSVDDGQSEADAAFVVLGGEEGFEDLGQHVVGDTGPVPSLVPIWKSAEWNERETYDMFGIQFAGHPDLRRILMPDDYTDYPLRKEFPLYRG